MWLIHTKTIDLKHHTDPIPPYAILSHTWTGSEITFQDLRLSEAQKDHFRHSAGFKKVLQTCRLAQEQGVEYAWVDTCCIDRTSSAELSEAINSMYSWYKQSAVCYAHLEDFDGGLPDGDSEFIKQSGFGRCRWFTRGWTLQELIAPQRLIFYDSMWMLIAEKHQISGTLQTITGIDEEILTGRLNMSSASVRTRMTWAAGRRTTRTEDIAYCLLGIFDVNMPLIYGEGYKAFQRLQQEIATKFSGDMTLFAWSPGAPLPLRNDRPPDFFHTRGVNVPCYRGAFAWTPEEFMVDGNVHASFEEKDSVASPGRIELDARSGVVLRNISLRWEGLLSPPRFFIEIPLGHGKLLCRAVQKTPQGYAFKSVIIPKKLNGWRYSAAEVRLVSQVDAVALEASHAPNVYLRVDLKVALVTPTLVWPAERWDRLPQWFTYALPELANMVRPTILGVALVRPMVNVEVAAGLWESKRLDIISATCVIPPSSAESLEEAERLRLGPPKVLGIILVKQSSNRFARIVHSFIEGETEDSLHDAVLYMQRNLRSSPQAWEDWVEGFDQRGQELDLQADSKFRSGVPSDVRVRTFSAERPVEYVEGNFWWNLEIWHDVRDKQGNWVHTSWVTPFNQWDPDEERFKRVFSKQTIVPLRDEIIINTQPSWQARMSRMRRKSTRTLVERASRISTLDK